MTTASLAGQVVKEPGGEPIKKALIELIEDGAESTHNYTATSDLEGHFEISGIHPGRYRILIERTGYLFVDARHHHTDAAAISLEGGQVLAEQLFRMLPAAVLTGRVLDEDGDPMPEANVSVLRRVPGSAGRTEQVAGERTNDVGQYRISGIMPGRYLISVTPPPDLATLLSDRKEANAKSNLAYVPTFYPNTTDRAQAGLIDLHAGDEVPVDFGLVRVATARIRGTVVNLAAGAQSTVSLHSIDGGLVFTQAEVGADGKFELRNIAPGSYSLFAVESVGDVARIARQSEQVAGVNIDGVRLVPLPGATLRGQMRAGGLPVDFSRIALSLIPADDVNPDATIGSVGAAVGKPDGSFEWKDVPPGRYYLMPTALQDSLANYVIDSVNVGGRDVRDSGLTASGGTMFLDVALSSRGAKLEGFVVDDKDRPVPNAVVVAVPEEKFRPRPDRYTRAIADQRGHFSMQGLLPGTYSLLAWESLEGNPYVDADFRKPYEEQAVPLRLDGGIQGHITLKALPAPEDQP